MVMMVVLDTASDSRGGRFPNLLLKILRLIKLLLSLSPFTTPSLCFLYQDGNGSHNKYVLLHTNTTIIIQKKNSCKSFSLLLCGSSTGETIQNIQKCVFFYFKSMPGEYIM